MSILSHATFVSLRCVFICVFPHHISYISLYTVAVLMHKQRWASGGKIWKQETLGAVWMADSPRAQERCQLASDTSESWESFSAFLPVFLTFLPSLCCSFFYVCLHHPLTPSPRSYFSPPARCCEPGFLPSILPPLWVCIGGETHLPTRNDIIVLIGSQSDGSTWSPAFRGALCTQERQRGEGGKKESLKWISGQTEAYTGTEG